MRETLSARVQYGDWTGTVQADDADIMLTSIHGLLTDRKLIEPGEFLFAIRMFNGENTNLTGLADCYLTAYVVVAENYAAAEEAVSANPIACRAIEMSLSAEEFFRMFKRFSVALSWQNLRVVGRELDYTEPA